jgi:hypothetical protein
LNCDEQYLPGTLARVAEVFRKNPAADVVFGSMLIVGPDGQPLAARREVPLRTLYVKNAFLYAPTCATFFRRRLWDCGLLRLNTAYRYAADMDLMLRLLTARRRVVHIRDYLSLFGVDGGNLSTVHAAKMDAEAESIRRAYQAWPSRLRLWVRLARCVERLLRGCYRSDMVAYDFATDEQPNSRHFPASKIGFRFTYQRAALQLVGCSGRGLK